MTYQCDPCVCPDQHYRDNDSFKKAVITVLCSMTDRLVDILGAVEGGTPPSAAAVFEPLVSVDSAGINAAYAVVETLPANTRSFSIVNYTNGDVYVSMDGGATDTYMLPPSQGVSSNLYELGVTTATQISLKDGAFPATTGVVLIYSIK